MAVVMRRECCAPPRRQVAAPDSDSWPTEYPYVRLAVLIAADMQEYTGPVMCGTQGRRVSPSLLRARQRALRCRQMTNNPPPVQASGGLLVFRVGDPPKKGRKNA